MEMRPLHSAAADLYALTLGKLMGNIASLELSLRMALYRSQTPAKPGERVMVSLTEVTQGSLLPENWITSWHTLKQLLEEYNRRNPQAPVPRDIVDIRDAFAHGRVLTADPLKPLTLVRFSQPKDGQVRVERVHTLTIDWMNQQIHHVRDVVNAVHRRLAEFPAETPPG